jgi:hypothetical protein
MISSVQETDKEILQSISKMHLQDEWFELDPCFSSGKFYRDLPEPKYKFDKSPQREDVLQNDLITQQLPFDKNTLKSIIFDPPFMFGVHGQTKNNQMNKRFSMFQNFAELEKMYKSSLNQFYEILKPKGILAFKCQDYTDSKTTLTHCFVYNWALENGFYAKDLFILNRKGGKIYNPNLTQRHARKAHCYWFVFQK